jgi:hypothetical protein
MDPADLYGLPLERFTEQRNALAKELRHENRRDDATAVSKLRKPSVAAWAVNQLVRTQDREVKALFAAGDALRRAQSDLLEGHAEPGALREAVEAERVAVEELAAKAQGLLSPDGHALSPTKLEQVTETLHAAALDESARAKVRGGCLDRELRHVGLGASADTTAPPPRGGRRGSRASGGTKPNGRRETQEHAARLKDARRHEAEARRRMERAARELRTAEDRHARAAEAMGQAEATLAEVREHFQETAREHREAEARVRTLAG